MNYAEQNRKTLNEALARLPQYSPPDSLWGQIEFELGHEENERALQDALDRLPSYSPPGSVWEAIETGLAQPQQAHRFRLRRLLWPAAASVAAIVAWFLFFPSGDAGLHPVYSYTTERASLELYGNDWDSDDQAMKTVVEQFSRDPLAKRQQEYGRILEEWQELEEAKSEVREIMSRYGKDARLVLQMSEIERERSKLAKAMAMAI